jgi:FixJ family two-component response regulator
LRVDETVPVLPVRAWVAVAASIYVVDDDQAVRDSVQTLLEIYGYDVQCFTSGEAFMRGFDGRPDACLILDVLMPGMSGLELLRLAGQRWADLPVIMISGHAERLSKRSLVTKGAVDFLPKPFSDVAIVEAIERALAAEVPPV